MSTSIRELLRDRDLVSIASGASAMEAARSMELEGVGCLIVLADDGTAEGIVTDRDIALRVAGCPETPADQVPVHKIMSTPVVAIEGTEDLDSAIHKLRTRGIRRLVVTDAHNIPLTVLSLDDLLDELSRDLHSLAQDAHDQVADSRRDARIAELRADVEEAVEGVVLRLQRANWLTREAFTQELSSIKGRIERALHLGHKP